jgi:DNA-binding MarR family transcriptional regulator
VSPSDPGGEGGAFRDELEGLDRLLEHRVRLAVCVLLVRHDELPFTRLLDLTGETNGNLGANLRRLEEEGYLTVRKEFVRRRPVSWYRLTRKGRAALRAHVAALDRLLHR